MCFTGFDFKKTHFMLPLDDKYFEKLESIAGEIQASDDLAAYLEEEEEESFNAMKDAYEPQIQALHREVAENDPLQLVALEKALLHEAFEGLFLPRILGFSSLRGEIHTDTMKYVRPQEHFQEVLLAICNSANFDILRKRIGQTIQTGFFLSSNIWVTNLINEISNKRIRNFLNTQRLDRYRTPEGRREGYTRYGRQFKNEVFQSAVFPTNKAELQVYYNKLKQFLLSRFKTNQVNTTVVPHMRALIENEAFFGMREHLEIMALYANFFDLSDADKKHLSDIFNKCRKENSGFAGMWFDFTLELHNRAIDLDKAADERITGILDAKVEDGLTEYYALMTELHSKGYMNPEAQEAVKVYYHSHSGLSTENECVRRAIYNYFARLLNNIETSEYTELFEVSKYYGIYMQIFGNQQFNQDLEHLSMKYVRKLLKVYVDKRGRDYQDIKKFVSTTFIDLKFLKEKEVVALFKSRRKRKKPSDNK